MIKAKTTLPDGDTLLVLGLTRANVCELLKDRPICFAASEMRLPLPDDVYIVIGYLHKDGEMARPVAEDLPDANQLVIALDDEALVRLTTHDFQTMAYEKIHVCLIYRETKEELESMFIKFIGPLTEVTRTGFPTRFDPSLN